jgi:hypothetical protein
MEENKFIPTNITSGIYNLLVTRDRTRACMDFNPYSNRYPEELVNSSFEREVYFLEKLSNLNINWIPENIKIDKLGRKIYFEWYNNTCENYLPDNWLEKLKTILIELDSLKIYKPSLYPKCFYSDDRGNLRTYSFYTSCFHNDCIVDLNFYKPILNQDRLSLVESISKDGKLDVSLLMKYAINDYVEWPDNALKKIYLELNK